VPDCGWAVVTAVEAELGDYATVHPLDPGMIEARKATFAGKWPYESKKGWKCKSKQVRDHSYLHAYFFGKHSDVRHSSLRQGGFTLRLSNLMTWQRVPTATSLLMAGRRATNQCE
jgi:hypothetical protein